jgi:hypothetical protein
MPSDIITLPTTDVEVLK